MFVVKHRSSLATAAIGLIALLAVARSQATQAPATAVSPGSDRPARATSTGWTPVAAPQSEETGPWLDHELMVAARDGESLVWIAAEHGATLRRPVGPSGYGAVTVPQGQDAAQLRSALLADPRVRSAERVGRIQGAKSKASRESSEGEEASEESSKEVSAATGLDWHRGAINAPTLRAGEAASYVVAVLDTGVAYENYKSDGDKYKAAPSLKKSSFVSAYDFVNGDTHANDDNQHGTHIASLIASSGSYTGVVPGVTLMPLKVLDAFSSGSEVDLVDAITHAADHGADVINMSLCFSEGYVPSSALQEALEYASDLGVVMVAAAGNDASGIARYPGASPLVISVGATTLAGKTGLRVTDYSNTGATLDVMAPGGDLTADRDGNGVLDGVLAETFDPASPTRFGAWMFAGTSQSAALVSGAAVLAIRAGATDPQDVALVIQDGAGSGFGAVDLAGGLGAGSLDVTGAESAVAGLSAIRLSGGVAVAALPYLSALDGGAGVQPALKLTALSATGAPLADVELLVSFWGSGGEDVVSCVTTSAGTCTVTGPAVAARDASAARLPLAFAFGLDGAIYQDRVIYRPSGGMFASDGLVLLAQAMEDAALLEGTLLAWRWDEATDSDLGPIADALMLVDAGAGLSSRPVGVVFTPEALGDAAVSDADLDLTGTGLISDPLGLWSVKLVTLSGSGLISDPLGLSDFRLLVMSASGLISDPLGFRAMDVYSNTGWTFSGAGLISDPLGFSGLSVNLKTGMSMAGESLDGTALGDLLDAGGWTTDDGVSGGALLGGSVALGAD